MKPATKTKNAKTNPKVTDALEQSAAPDALQRVASIATAAYFKAEERGFAPGGELDDWLAAEVEIESRSVKRR